MAFVKPLALLALLVCVTALPAWSWDTVQIYVHCCNQSGPWNEEALGKMKALGAGLRFVVQERETSRFQAPVNRSAESKMIAAAKQVRKALGNEIKVLMYNPTFPAVEWYDYARNVEAAHPDSLIHYANGTTVKWKGCPQGGCGGDGVGDYTNEYWRQAWVEGMVSTADSGVIDGVFIDGFRGNVAKGQMGPPVNPDPKNRSSTFPKDWAVGLNSSMNRLVQGLGPNGSIICNYGYPTAPPTCNGMMMERGGSGAKDIETLQTYAGRIVQVS
jgi:hypothetical protein